MYLVTRHLNCTANSGSPPLPIALVCEGVSRHVVLASTRRVIRGDPFFPCLLHAPQGQVREQVKENTRMPSTAAASGPLGEVSSAAGLRWPSPDRNEDLTG